MDDLLHLCHDLEVFMGYLKGVYRFKYDILGPPTQYLGANVEDVQSGDSSIAWLETSEEYCHVGIGNVDKMLELEGTRNLKVFGTMASERPFK